MEQKENQIDGIIFVDYKDESQLDSVMGMVAKDLSEPYSSKRQSIYSRIVINFFLTLSFKFLHIVTFCSAFPNSASWRVPKINLMSLLDVWWER